MEDDEGALVAMFGDRAGNAWWRGRADGFKAADTVLLAAMRAAKEKGK